MLRSASSTRRSRWLAAAPFAAALLLAVALPVLAQGRAYAPAWPVSADLPAEARQFDFWVGEWDVNLRIRQPDFSWKDTHRAVARIYPILNGKAVLELWDSERIKGYSLRYYDPARGEWTLWLNWPGANRAGSSSLSGGFRHGRGDFFSSSENADGTTTLARYSFNDIGPRSLRWDDAYTRDGGETWSNNWIMEFSRTADVPTLDPAGGDAHTYAGGGRCTADGFAPLDRLVGRFEGRLAGDAEPAAPATLRGYRVLGGCAVLVFLDWEEDGRPRQRFAHLTYNTGADRPEITILDDRPASAARVLYGDVGSRELVWSQARAGENGGTARVTLSGNGAFTWIDEAPAGDDDAPRTWRAEFEPLSPAR